MAPIQTRDGAWISIGGLRCNVVFRVAFEPSSGKEMVKLAQTCVRGSATTQLVFCRTEEHIEHLQQQFALVGDRKGETVLVKDGPADYLLYVSGRRNVQFSHWWIKVIVICDVALPKKTDHS